jgi:hypothetical protein
MIALTGGSDDRHAAGDSELDGEGAYPAGGPVDEKRLAGVETKSFQHSVCGAPGSSKRSCYLPSDFVRLADQTRWFGERVFCE